MIVEPEELQRRRYREARVRRYCEVLAKYKNRWKLFETDDLPVPEEEDGFLWGGFMWD